MSKLGIIAGGGDLPRAVAQSARESGRDVFVVSLTGRNDDWTMQFPRETVSLGEIGKTLRALSSNDCNEVIFAGRVDRPRLSDVRLDAKGAKLMPRVAAAAMKGDDALLRAIVEIFEREGHRVVSIAEAAPSLVVRKGNVGKHEPSGDSMKDIAKGFEVVARLGELDIGQAAAVCDGLVLAVEAAEGTDRMLKRVAELPERLRGTPAKRRGVLVKAPKPIQDRKTDLPVIGVETVRNVAAAGLAGIALEADGALIVDRDHVVRAANSANIFIAGIEIPKA
ncbi:MAG TPA: UDP-2,3-diacylglucosamine diphosphatase LpxI [Rhizomicrobium sp.]|nr:UDP-2,3-diacylglucosamine diphosphatase LpxI [Rhizomicrobium sp.]